MNEAIQAIAAELGWTYREVRKAPSSSYPDGKLLNYHFEKDGLVFVFNQKRGGFCSVSMGSYVLVEPYRFDWSGHVHLSGKAEEIARQALSQITQSKFLDRLEALKRQAQKKAMDELQKADKELAEFVLFRADVEQPAAF